MKNSYLVCGSAILPSRKKFDVVEGRMFYYMMYCYMNQLISSDEDSSVDFNKEVVLTTSDIRKALGKSYSVKEMIDILNGMPKTVEVKKIHGKEVAYGEISCFDYFYLDKKTFDLVFRFSNIFIEHYKDIFKQFSYMDIEDLYKLKSKHAVRLYELYCQYVNQGNLKLSVDDVYDFFFYDCYDYVLDDNGEIIDKERSMSMSNVLRAVADRAVKEINDKLDLKVKVKKVKKGKTITHLIFDFGEKREVNKKIMFIVKQLKSAICHDNDNQQFKNEHLDNGDVIHKLPVDIDDIQELTDYIANL